MAVTRRTGGGPPPLDPEVERVIMELREAKRRGALRDVIKASLRFEAEEERADSGHAKRLESLDEALRTAVLGAADALKPRPITEADIRLAETRLARQRGGKAARKAKKPSPPPFGNVVKLHRD